MSDRDIIKGLIEHDNKITEEFFFVRCRPLLSTVIGLVYKYPVKYEEAVNALYEYLIEDNAARLRQFQFRSSVFQWIKVVAIRFFLRRREAMIENVSKENLFEYRDIDNKADTLKNIEHKIDIQKLLSLLENQRYADIIRNLVLKDMEPEKYASEIGVTVDNLYNLKRRAMAAFTKIVLNNYGNEK